MVSEIRDALTVFKDDNYQVHGFIWLQGWNDVISQEAMAEYDANLTKLAREIRSELNSPTLPFIVGELDKLGPEEADSAIAPFRFAQ